MLRRVINIVQIAWFGEFNALWQGKLIVEDIMLNKND